MPIKSKEIMTAKEVAVYLNIHPLTVHKFAREGKIPAFKIGTDWRFHKKYIDDWIKEKLEFNQNGKERRKNHLGDNFQANEEICLPDPSKESKAA